MPVTVIDLDGDDVPSPRPPPARNASISERAATPLIHQMETMLSNLNTKRQRLLHQLPSYTSVPQQTVPTSHRQQQETAHQNVEPTNQTYQYPVPSEPDVFPITPFVSDFSDPVIHTMANAIDNLYFGPSQGINLSRNFSHFPEEAIERLRDTLKLTQPNQLNVSNFPDDNRQSYSSENEVMLNLMSPNVSLFDMPLEKGQFTTINAEKIDIPADRTKRFHPKQWIGILPQAASDFFNPEKKEFILEHLLEAVLDNSKCKHCTADDKHYNYPPGKVKCLPRNYGRLLERLTYSGMIIWGLLADEDSTYSRIANKLTMSAFAVVKDEKRDRLVTWPRTQNHMVPDAPKVNLPHPSQFGLFRATPDLRFSAFCIDIANMSHHISLPQHLVRYFPLQTICFRDLPRKLQAFLIKQFGKHISQDEFLRPCQATMSIGFKWSVYIIHTISQYLVRRSWNEFRASRLAPKPSRTIVLADMYRPISLKHFDAVLCHIIDDVNLVLVDWPSKSTVKLHEILETMFEKHGLPIKRSKSTPRGEILYSTMTFIGWTWHLDKLMITPRLEKMEQCRKYTEKLVEETQWTPEILRRSIGKITWAALGRRPLLSTLQSVFHTSGKVEREELFTPLPQARTELNQLTSLVPLSCIKLHRKTWTTVIAISASIRFVKLTYTTVSESQVEHLIDLAHGDVKRPPNNVDETLQHSEQEISKFINSNEWKTGFIYSWDNRTFETALQARAAELALGWASKHPIAGHRLLFLFDSPTVVKALRKGRSSTTAINRHCRRFAALTLTFDVDPYFLLINTKLNPALVPGKQIPKDHSTNRDTLGTNLVPVQTEMDIIDLTLDEL